MRNRVVHRDIKPANILLDAHRAHGVYLCDLGLGRDLEVATPEQMRNGAGTPMYMAPERLLRAPADEVLCDIYSLGVTLFETFTLGRPFRPPDGMPMACLAAYLAHAEPRRPADVRPGLPPDLALLVQKAMSRIPADRYASAGELAADLDRFLIRWSFRAGRSVRHSCPRHPGPHQPVEPGMGIRARLATLGVPPGHRALNRRIAAGPRPVRLIGAEPGDRLDWSRFTPQARHSWK